MISNELLSEVLDMEIADIPPKDKNSKFVYYRELSLITHSINIHELAHLCKAWAKNQGYVIGVDLDKVNIWSIKERRVVNHFEVYWEDYLEFEFKACEWIYKNCKKDK